MYTYTPAKDTLHACDETDHERLDQEIVCLTVSQDSFFFWGGGVNYNQTQLPFWNCKIKFQSES